MSLCVGGEVGVVAAVAERWTVADTMVVAVAAVHTAWLRLGSARAVDKVHVVVGHWCILAVVEVERKGRTVRVGLYSSFLRRYRKQTVAVDRLVGYWDRCLQRLVARNRRVRRGFVAYK